MGYFEFREQQRPTVSDYLETAAFSALGGVANLGLSQSLGRYAAPFSPSAYGLPVVSLEPPANEWCTQRYSCGPGSREPFGNGWYSQRSMFGPGSIEPSFNGWYGQRNMFGPRQMQPQFIPVENFRPSMPPVPPGFPMPSPIPGPGDCRTADCYPRVPQPLPPIEIDMDNPPIGSYRGRPDMTRSRQMPQENSQPAQRKERPDAAEPCNTQKTPENSSRAHNERVINYPDGTHAKIRLSDNGKGGKQIDEFTSADGVKYKRAELTPAEQKILTRKLGHEPGPEYAAWIVEKGAGGRSNGNSDRRVLGSMSIDGSKKTISMNTTYPVPQETVYYPDGSFTHGYKNGAKTTNSAVLHGQRTVFQEWPGHNTERELRRAEDGSLSVYDRDKKTGKIQEADLSLSVDEAYGPGKSDGKAGKPNSSPAAADGSKKPAKQSDGAGSRKPDKQSDDAGANSGSQADCAKTEDKGSGSQKNSGTESQKTELPKTEDRDSADSDTGRHEPGRDGMLASNNSRVGQNRHERSSVQSRQKPSSVPDGHERSSAPDGHEQGSAQDGREQGSEREQPKPVSQTAEHKSRPVDTSASAAGSSGEGAADKGPADKSSRPQESDGSDLPLW